MPTIRQAPELTGMRTAGCPGGLCRRATCALPRRLCHRPASCARRGALSALYRNACKRSPFQGHPASYHVICTSRIATCHEESEPSLRQPLPLYHDIPVAPKHKVGAHTNTDTGAPSSDCACEPDQAQIKRLPACWSTATPAWPRAAACVHASQKRRQWAWLGSAPGGRHAHIAGLGGQLQRARLAHGDHRRPEQRRARKQVHHDHRHLRAPGQS